MAMNGDVLGAALKSAMSLTPNPMESMDAVRTRVFKAMGDTIVAHIETFAVVTSTVTVASVSGVTAGAATSGPGTGTATGTIA